MRAPVSTYRLQITDTFTLLDAARTLTYLHDLGVDWVYLSPLLSSETGSAHGYDVSDHSTVDPSRGRASGLAAVASEARRLGMGVLVDIVPNHVGVAAPYENQWWWHVLTHGPESPYASAFDIDWDAGDGRLRIPVVGDDDLVEDPATGQVRIANLRVLAGELHYHDQRFPLAPGTADLGPDADPDAVHARQHYELVGWRRADQELNYRRFFAVNTLAAIRVEEPEWFAASHEEIGRWFTEGWVDGLRVDHPDGLRDPAKYLEDLAGLTGHAYVLVEKILEPGEELPRSWATAGTTGYDALALVDRVLVDPAGEKPLDELEAELRGAPVDWPTLIHDTKRAVADGILGSETRRIAREALAVLAAAEADVEPDSDADRSASAEDGPASPDAIVDAVAELLACFPVYRSYLPQGREHLEQAFTAARTHRPDLGATLDVLEPVLADGAAAPAQRFQQTSGMVMAKGVEDCAFYRWARLTSLNEVGADPDVFALDPAGFHAAMERRQRDWPQAMTAASTHDTKRGEDVRARISVLAELPEVWADALRELLRLVPLPDPGFGNLLWQAVLGVWPADARQDPDTLRARLHAYAEKAMREAGDHTQWTDVDETYEAAVHRAVDAALDDAAVGAVLDGLLARIAAPGWSNALAAKLLGLTLPGVPDVYQGSELWEQSLVDPDNRRPVDFEERTALLKRLRTGERPAVPETLDDQGATKLLLTHLALTLHRDRAEAFTTYEPVAAEGPAAAHVLAYDRGGVLPVVTRLPVGLRAAGGWGDTVLALPPGRWRDALTGRRVRPDEQGRASLATLLATYPVALLVRERVAEAGRGRFDVWAPLPTTVALRVGDRDLPMERGDDGWWTPAGPEPLGEVDYGFVLDGEQTPRPDPRSRRQPRGVHGLSRTFDPAAHAWQDAGWTGRQLAGSVVYELHVGTFTPDGTLDAAIERLPHLVDLGVDLVELMPVNAFNGEHGWGYDGVAWFAVHEQYGGPAAYQRFVDAAHAAGLGVVQDVVYNHFGPSGNYLPLYGPYLSEEGENPWGAHVNLDGAGSAEVRAYVLDNVRMWFEDLHVDGLRLDAVHALQDTSEPHLLAEIGALADRLSAALRRPLTVIAESDLNDSRMVLPLEGGGTGLTAQWSDDFHHAVHAALTGETSGYYADFAPLSALAKVEEKGFFHDGTLSTFRGAPHGRPVHAGMPGWRLVVCNQNHDQVGNRARGDRLAEHLDDDQLAVAAMLTLTSPYTPMLFQGEEWAASTPFAFFTSHPEEDLGRAVSEGRLAEFAQMDWDTSTIPDPQDPATFASSKLDWSEVDQGRHRVLLDCYRELVALRRRTPSLTNPDLGAVSCTVDEDARWVLLRRGGAGAPVWVAANLGEAEVEIPLPGGDAEVVWATPAGAVVRGDRVLLPAHAGAVLVTFP